MKLPTDIETLMAEWTKDAKIDETEPGRELLKISSLQSKYINVFAYHEMVAKKLAVDYAKKKRIKWDYYSGELNNPEDLAKYGLEPIRRKILRQDMPIFLDSDEDLTNILLRKVHHEEIVEVAKMICKELNSRTYQLRAFIDREKFLAGG